MAKQTNEKDTNVNSIYNHPPVILLLGEQSGANTFVKAWFEKSRFRTVQTSDLFRVLEEISDFTVACSPDVIIFEASFQYDLSAINELVQTSSLASNLPIFTLSASGNFTDFKRSFEGNLHQLNAELDSIIPLPADTYRAAV